MSCRSALYAILWFFIIGTAAANSQQANDFSFLPELEHEYDINDINNAYNAYEYVPSSCSPIDVAFLYVGRRPIHPSHPPRYIEALTSLASLLYYRTCPITLHLLLYRRDVPEFVSFQERHRASSAWFATDMAENAHRPLCGAPAQPPPVVFNYILLDNKPIADMLFGELPYEECRQKDAVHKLIMEKLLPNTVDRVLVLDFDTLVVRDICLLWREAFEELSGGSDDASTPFMALAPEMAPYYSKVEVGRLLRFPSEDKSWLPDVFTGLNSGVIFMNLRAMRDEHWDDMWSSTIRAWYREYHWVHPSPRWFMFALGDQNVFNYVLRQHPDRARTLSNAFNFQLYTVFILQEYNLPQLLCPHVGDIGIFHGNGYVFLKEHALKTNIWRLFFNPILPEYTVATTTTTHFPAKNNTHGASELAKMRQTRSIVKWLWEWQRCGGGENEKNNENKNLT